MGWALHGNGRKMEASSGRRSGICFMMVWNLCMVLADEEQYCTSICSWTSEMLESIKSKRIKTFLEVFFVLAP